MQRGRKSAATLSIVTQIETRRPPPPEELTEAQAAEWRATTGTMPAGWFGRETHPVLASYCRHVCRSRWLAGQIDTHADRLLKAEGGVQMLDKMFGMAEREGRAVLAHARSLRLNQQARYDARAAGRKGDGPQASYYETGDDDDDRY